MSSSSAILNIRPDREAALASQLTPPVSADIQFTRPDWQLFRSVETLPSQAGVRKGLLRRLALKELVDNALDAGSGSVDIQSIGRDTYVVTDDGPGIPGGAAAITRLFSVNRPMVSTKIWRLPTRGALGNGLRVVTGAVDASTGSLRVSTGGRCYTLQPAEDGTTIITADDPSDCTIGTAVEITFGAALPTSGDDEAWAGAAILMSRGTSYTGKSSPHWYCAESFSMMLQSAGNHLVRELVERLDGCSGGKAGKITADLKGRTCRSLSREEATTLLVKAKALARPVRPERLGEVGRPVALPEAYAIKRGVVRVGEGSPKAELPVVVETWVDAEPRGKAGDEVSLELFVNRTPAVAPISAWRSSGRLRVTGCGLNHSFEIGAGRYEITVNLTTPHCPISTIGKEPDLSAFVRHLAAAIQAAARKAKSALPRANANGTLSYKDAVLGHLVEAVGKASTSGRFRFNQRQLFYAMRPLIQRRVKGELQWENFCKIVTEYEAEFSDIQGMTRDARGSFYHPHLGENIALGTLAVEEYRKPEWTFSQILYCEKEGLFEALKETRWPERHDCALLSSKGYATRAVRDLIDLLGAGDEPVKVFCIHDADASGTMIFQGLQEATRARGRRTVEIINFGLEPWEADDMGLAVEGVAEKERRQPVADYVLGRADGEHWAEWLQTARVELNELTTAQLIEWLDAKMLEHGAGKVMPPPEVATGHLEVRLRDQVRVEETAAILAEADLDRRVEERLGTIRQPSGAELLDEIEVGLCENEDEHWRQVVDEAVTRLAGGAP